MKSLPRLAAPLLALLAGCGASPDLNALPSFVVQGSVTSKTYDGNSDDLLTGGLGASGLVSTANPPGFVNPVSPTPGELRRRAIYTNYRALLDVSPNGGYGTLYGPNVAADGTPTPGEGRIAGEEWLAFDDDGTGRINVTLMVQVPASFDPANPCIVTGTSSGSRGVYGAIATAGEWGLKRGCAVAYTDKGSGMGVEDLQNGTVDALDGTRADAADAGTRSTFTADLSDADRAAYNAASPNRFAVKHAHSQQNPEKDWGKYTLHAVEFAYYVLNQKFGAPPGDAGSAQATRKYHPGQILTIAASVSNGAGASLAAAEQDAQHFISGVVAGEPQVQVASAPAITRGGTAVSASARPLYDYLTQAALYQGCAAGASTVVGASSMASLTIQQITTRCAGLRAKGLLTATNQQAQSDEALQKLHAAGYEADADLLHSTHFSSYATVAVAVTYANAYARASVKDNLCGYSFAAVDSVSGNVAPVGSSSANAQGLAQIFGTGNGVPPMGPIQLIANLSSGGARQDQLSTSASRPWPGEVGSVTDFNLDGMDCLRSLWTGADDAGAPLTGALLAQSNALKAGVQEVLRTARLRGVPAILVQGRNDALVPVNHGARAYLAANKAAEGAGSPTVYYEVTNAQHFDAFITAFTGYQTRFVPLHRYVLQALDLMYARLKTGAALPPSQVVRTDPRNTAGSTIQGSNVPPISANPAPADRITFANGTLDVPN